MPRNYQRKRGSKPYKTGYSEKDMDDAIAYHNNNGGSIRGVAKKFGVPHVTLSSKIKGNALLLLFYC